MNIIRCDESQYPFLLQLKMNPKTLIVFANSVLTVTALRIISALIFMMKLPSNKKAINDS